MMWPDRDRYHRTAKLLVDSGRAASPQEATAILRTYVLQLDVGPGLAGDPAGQSALLTAVNAGSRAFLGGVAARVGDDPVVIVPWGAGRRLSSLIAELGGQVVKHLQASHPTVVFGRPTNAGPGSVVVYPAWQGWGGGVVTDEAGRSADRGMALAGVLAGGLAVSECFQHRLGSPVAGRRDIGLSLWRPELDWRSQEAHGPDLSRLPLSVWLLGLGHLGQSYAWSLGCLPYGPGKPTVYLMDTDSVVEANVDTGLLTTLQDEGTKKTRLVADRLGRLGFSTAIVERRFDEHTSPTPAEPSIAIGGFDDPAPRRLLGRAGFAHVIDGGLGAGRVGYLDIVLRTFPSRLDPEMVYAGRHEEAEAMPPAYQAEIDRLVSEGVAYGDATCGMAEMAGLAVGASFVGAVAGSFAIADLLRRLHGGSEYSIVSADLRNPLARDAVTNVAPASPSNPGYLTAV